MMDDCEESPVSVLSTSVEMGSASINGTVTQEKDGMFMIVVITAGSVTIASFHDEAHDEDTVSSITVSELV